MDEISSVMTDLTGKVLFIADKHNVDRNNAMQLSLIHIFKMPEKVLYRPLRGISTPSAINAILHLV